MRRDMDLVRQILFSLEEMPDHNLHPVAIEGKTPTEVSFHLRIMEEAGLVRLPQNAGSLGKASIHATLKWDGYEFLDKARKDTIWAKAKDHAMNVTGGLSLHAVTTALGVVIQQALTGSSG